MAERVTVQRAVEAYWIVGRIYSTWNIPWVVANRSSNQSWKEQNKLLYCSTETSRLLRNSS